MWKDTKSNFKKSIAVLYNNNRHSEKKIKDTIYHSIKDNRTSWNKS